MKSMMYGYNRLSKMLTVDLDEMELPEGQKVQIHSIEPQADSSLWKLSFTSSYNSQPEEAQKMEALLDSKDFFNVVEMTELRSGGSLMHKLETNELAGAPIVTRWSSSVGEKETFLGTITPLSVQEAAQVKETVESAIANAEEPAPDSLANENENRWRDRLISPTALAIGWPLLGIIFLAVDWVCDRLRWKAN